MAENEKRMAQNLSRIEVFGKDRLGEFGVCLYTSKIKESKGEIYNNIDYICNVVNAISKGATLVMTSLTNSEDIAYQGGDYIPTVVTYDVHNAYSKTFSLKGMYEQKRDGVLIPTADFICWDKKSCNYNLAVATFSRTAPVLYFETFNGMCCLGTVHKKPILKHGEYIFKKIINQLTYEKGITEDNPICCRLVTCTDYEYPNIGTIDSQIKPVLESIGITDYQFMYGTNANKDWLYQDGEVGDHVVVVMN